ncbi:hypothetical protein [Microscilla marina]|nr:hypothetical protein [Microscilla marina]
MKNPSKTFTTKEGQKPPIQAKQRPIQAKQRPIQAKQRPIQAKQSPIQRKPNVDNQDLKTQMGKQYGVDLSGYKEHQNSSFPDKVGAQATIQGKDIHYASGQFTLQNRKHELGHAIDNTLNGTPQGNTTIQGYNIDTTREEVADKIMHTPLQKQSDDTTPVVQQKSKSSGKTVLQRKGEKKALRTTLEPNPDLGYKRMRRGNRRGSVSNTQGLSTIKVAYLRDYVETWTWEKKSDNDNKKVPQKGSFFIQELIAREDDILNCLPKKTNFNAWVSKHHKALKAYLFSYLGVGNCGTFSQVITEQLKANTTDQWVVQCSMVSDMNYYDHAFVLTLPNKPKRVELNNAIVGITRNGGEVKDRRETVNVLDRDINPEECTVVDGWNNYELMTLKQFQNGKNPYNKELNNSNIRVEKKHKATGYDPVAPIRNILQDIAKKCMQDLNQQLKEDKPQIIQKPWENWTSYPRVQNYKKKKDDVLAVLSSDFDKENAPKEQQELHRLMYDFHGSNTINDQRPLATQLKDPDTTDQELEKLLQGAVNFDDDTKKTVIKSFDWDRLGEIPKIVNTYLFAMVFMGNSNSTSMTELFLQTINNDANKVIKILGGEKDYRAILKIVKEEKRKLLNQVLNNNNDNSN